MIVDPIEARIRSWRSATLSFLLTNHPSTSDESFAHMTLFNLFLNLPESKLYARVVDEAGQDDWDPVGPALLVAPGTGYTSAIVGLFWMYMTGSTQIDVALSHRDRWSRRFIGILNDGITVVDYRASDLLHHLEKYKLLVVYGGSQTVADYRKAFHGATAVYYGPKTSIGVHNSLSFGPRDIAFYTRDISLYEGLGCLTPTVLYIPDSAAFAEFVPALAATLMGEADRDDKIVQREFVNECLVANVPTVGPVGIADELDLAVLPPTRGHGTVYVKSYVSPVDVMADWETHQGELSSCSLLPHPAPDIWEPILASIGVSRITVPGKAQDPPLSWQHDGMPSLKVLISHN